GNTDAYKHKGKCAYNKLRKDDRGHHTDKHQYSAILQRSFATQFPDHCIPYKTAGSHHDHKRSIAYHNKLFGGMDDFLKIYTAPVKHSTLGCHAEKANNTQLQKTSLRLGKETSFFFLWRFSWNQIALVN